MKKINYKGRCEKRKVSKCDDICRTYSRIQSAMVDVLEKDDDVRLFISFRPVKQYAEGKRKDFKNRKCRPQK